MKKVDVILLNPPFYRFLGSHNDKAPLSLCYLSTYLEKANISHIVYNADFTGSSKFWSIEWMHSNYESYIDAVNDKGSLYGEVIEKVLSYFPKVVVIMGGEPLIATTEWGNAFIAANFSIRLRIHNIFTIGIGPFYTLDTSKFIDSFDCIFKGEPSNKIIKVIKKKIKGVIPFNLNSLNICPNFKQLYPSKQKLDLVLTSFGCKFSCNFCLNGKLYKNHKVRYVNLKEVVKDIKSRKSKDIYIGDLNFALTSMKRLKNLYNLFKLNNINKNITIDARIDSLTEEKIKILKELNIKRIKVGIETINPILLKKYDKGINLNQIKNTLTLLKKYKIKYIFYLLLSKELNLKEFNETYKFIKKWKPEHIVPNLLAYDIKSDYKYDTEFSPLKLKEYKISKTIYIKYLKLQNNLNPTVGKIID